MLDGQGADEILLGYPSYYSVLLAGLIRQGRLFSFAREAAAFHRELGLGFSSQFASATNDLLPRGMTGALKRALGRANAAQTVLRETPDSPFFAEGRRRNLDAVSRAQVFSTNLPMLLHWEDRNSMANSVEARVPFLDHRLVEFCLGLPPEFKLSGGVSKRILRDALADEVPEVIRARRDKIGFATPETDWLRGPYRDQILAGCRTAIESWRTLFSKDAYEVIRASLDANVPYTSLAWRVQCFEKWTEVFNVLP
jgi:asparagine synthase (glutamine-hydrolysing)